MTVHGDDKLAHVFNADISAAFLKLFDFPADAPEAAAVVSIQHTIVPFEPYATFYSRLLGLILSNPHTMDTDVTSETMAPAQSEE